MKQAMLCLMVMLATPAARAQEAVVPTSPSDTDTHAQPTGSEPAQTAEPAAPSPAPAAAEQPAPPAAAQQPTTIDAPKAAKKTRPPHVRSWWSWGGIAAGLSLSALSALTAVAGVGVQVLALKFWIDQASPPAGAKQSEREMLTTRARNTQWIALGMVIPGIAAFFGGLILATYAFGYGNPDPKTAKDF